ncbi:hypothetical protein [Halothermothrix orenii]|uniref:CopG family transcriptional regulator n=1 Tax=Halothermothrix orenii (strain H 168 / OCM 544 / DSM 9562) TaxID=373903 RepID=B8D0P2_HALOH|nr:hypothetical protein [Halothermothrix orenii]ACL70978.1 hypothetical protein Hore_22330 [Halothermothrix orenii H 168]
MSDDKVTIKIPRPLYNNIKKVIDGTGFNSVTEFIVYVMRDLISTTEVKDKDREEIFSREDLIKEEINLIKQRLKSLGYLE